MEMRKPEINQLTEEKLRELYLDQNLTVKNIATAHNLSTATINRLLKKHGLSKSETQRRAAISKTKQNKTDEEKLLYSKRISEARKGKGIGINPWNKGTKGLQVAWNKGISTPGRPRTTESLEKARATCLTRYGVNWACQRPEARLKGQNSAANLSFEDLLIKNGIQYQRELAIENYSYDFNVGKYLIELNPYATHNSTWGIRNNPPKSKNYHKQKSALAQKFGYQCIHVFDWDDPQKIISILNNRPKIGARSCKIAEVSKEAARTFLEQHHLQGYAKDVIRLGLYYKGNLISIMTFGKPRYNKKYEYELIRYCSIFAVTGGAEKLFKHFITNHKPNTIISYCDQAKFEGKIYPSLGFTFLRTSSPAKHWYNPKTHQHITNNLLNQRGYDQLFKTEYGKGSSNAELMLNAGFVEIYDCGQVTFIWKAKEEL